MKIKSKLKYLIACLFSLYVASDSIAVNDLNKIRASFNQEQKKTEKRPKVSNSNYRTSQCALTDVTLWTCGNPIIL